MGDKRGLHAALLRLVAIPLTSGFLLHHSFLGLTHAQITLDGSLGPRQTLTGPNYVIGHDLGQSRGRNLFHSFGEFNVRTRESATFTGPDSIGNVLARVTGHNRSSIDGLLRSTIPGANLFLLNPKGVVFGPNASLDVSGSFHVSTADFVRLADGGLFHADLAKPTVLTVAPLTSFGFLAANPARISIQDSALTVPAGKTLSLVGGDVQITGGPLGFLQAPSGRIAIASVGSPGEVPFNSSTQSPELNVRAFERLGRIELSRQAILSTSGVAGGGTVVIRGGNLVVDGGSGILSHTLGDVPGAPIGLDIGVTGDVVVSNGSGLQSATIGTGDAGDIVVEAKNVILTGGHVFGGTQGSGDGGTVHIKVAETLSLDGTRAAPTGILSNNQTGNRTGSTGNAGDIIVEAQNVSVRGGAQINSSTAGRGTGGTVKVTARETISIDGFPSGIFASAEPGSTGSAGDVVLEAKNVTVTGAAQINSRTTSSGDGGTVRVTATDTINVDGSGISHGFVVRSGIFAHSEPGSTGDAGDIVIDAKHVTLSLGAQIASGTFGSGDGGTVQIKVAETMSLAGTGAAPTGIFSSSQTGSTGNAGDIIVEAKNVKLTGGAAIFSGTFGPGTGGAVKVTATERISLGGASAEGIGSVISSNTLGTGPGGVIDIGVAELHLQDGGAITSGSAGAGPGGTIKVRATEALTISGSGSGLFTNSLAEGRSGDIDVVAKHVGLTNGAQISAESEGVGNAGRLAITATDTFQSRNSSITTEAATADGGDIHLSVGSLLHLVDSRLTTSVGGGEGRGGNITIDPRFVVLDHSQVRADAFGGPGGNVNITADTFLASESLVSASSALNAPGTINIQASVTDLSESVAPLPAGLLQAATLLRASCAARVAAGKASSLVVAGREGLPLEPGGYLPSPLVTEELGGAESSRSEGHRWQTFPWALRSTLAPTCSR